MMDLAHDFHHTAVGHTVVSPAGEMIAVNDALCRLLQYDEAELLGRSVYDITHPDDVAKTVEATRPILDNVAEESTLEKRYIRKDGSVVHMVVAISAVRELDGSVAYLLGLMQDITRRKEAEDDLRASEDLLRVCFDGSASGLAVVGLDGRFLRVNDELCTLLGRPADELLEMCSVELMDGDCAADTLSQRMRMLSGECTGYRAERRLQRADGTCVDLALNVALVRGPDGQPKYVVSQATDLSETNRMEHELRAGEARTRSVLDSLAEVVFQFDAQARFTFLNRAWEALTGYSVAGSLGCLVGNFVHADDRAHAATMRNRALSGEFPRGDLRFRVVRVDQSVRFVECHFRTLSNVTGAGSAVLGTLVDITDRRRLEVELSHAHKLEAVGQLAAGVAHEINTPMQFVGDNLHFLHESFEELLTLLCAYREQLHDTSPRSDVKRQKQLDAAEDGVDFAFLQSEIPLAAAQALEGVRRVTTIVSAMKAFGHPDQGERRLADMNEALQNTLTVARNEYKYVADIDVDLGPIPLVDCVASDLNQVFLNLIVNAAHAIGDTVIGTPDRGLITVHTAFDEKHHDVVITIADTGTGVAPELVERIFEPFFTTKSVGRGTGQGLAIAHTIVAERHHGSLTFETALGVGTTFTIRLPVDADCEAVSQS
ncbi:MAG: putative Histidine kinase [Actinomycetia bacterium]|nr:putative Histidine kinase [Actinomycetes bacterium]